MVIGNRELQPRTQRLATDDEHRKVAKEIARLSSLSQSLVATDIDKSAQIGALVESLRETSYEDPDDGKDTKIPGLLAKASQY